LTAERGVHENVGRADEQKVDEKEQKGKHDN
jgi:hypothetical protein